MFIVRRAIALLGFLQFIFVGPALADFNVCQQSDQEAMVAYSYFNQQQRAWFIAGWYKIPPRSCRALHTGNVRNSRFYVYGEIPGTSFKWTGTFRLCVQRPEAFRIRNVGQSCDQTEMYDTVDTGQFSNFIYTLTLRPEQHQALRDELAPKPATPNVQRTEPRDAQKAESTNAPPADAPASSQPKEAPKKRVLLASPQTCYLKDGTASASNPAVTVKLTHAAEVRTGDSVLVDWEASGLDTKCHTPLYLMLTTPMRTRFEGEKFLALPPAAIAPFGIKYQADRTRILIPLHVDQRQLKGRMSVKVYETGPLTLDWALVEVPALVEEPQSKEEFAFGSEKVTAPAMLGQAIIVVSGNPAIVVRDQFSTDKPKLVVRSNSGEFELQIFDSFYRVLDAKTGELLRERAGWDPNFSPTSRFLGAYAAGPGLEIIDLYSGQVVTSNDILHRQRDFRGNVHLAAWSPGDAMLALSIQGYGGIEVAQSLVDGSHYSFPRTACHHCRGIDSALRVDAEGGLVSVQGNTETGWASLFDSTLGTQAASAYALTQVPSQAGERLNEPHDAAALVKALARRDSIKNDTASKMLATLAKVSFFEPDRLVTDFDPDKSSERVEENWRFPGRMQLSHLCLEGKDGKCVGRLVDYQEFLTDREDENARLFKMRVPHNELKSPATMPADDRSPQQADARLIDIRRGQQSRREKAENSETVWSRLAQVLVPGETGAGLRPISHGVDAAEFKRGNQSIAAAIARTAPKTAAILRASDKKDSIEDIGGDPYYGLKSEAKFIDPRAIRRVATWNVGDQNYWLIQSLFDFGESSRNWLFLLQGSKNGPARLVDLTHRLRTRVGRTPSGLDAQGDIELTGEFATTMGFGGWPSGFDRASIAFDRYLIASGFWTIDQRRWVLVYDLKTSQIRFFNRDIPEAATFSGLALTDDARTLIQTNSNGHLYFYDVASEKLVLQGVDIDDELVLYDPHGYYTATPEGAQFVYLKFHGLPGYNSFQQFARVLNRPDIVKAALNGKADAPDPHLTSPPSAALDVEMVQADKSRSAKLALSAASPVGLEKIRVFIDGRLANEYPVAGPSAATAATIVLQPEARWVTAVALDRAGHESVPQSRSLADAKEATSSRLFAIAVGTDRYDDPAIEQLNVAKADAVNFAKGLDALKGNAYGDIEVTSFLDRSDLRGALLARIRELAGKASERDTIVLFAAAHGFRDPATGDFQLVTRDSRLSSLAETSIGWKEIADALDGAKARVVVLLDTCHSGAAGNGTNDDAASALLKAKTSLVVIAASKGRQLSREVETGGVFTTALVKAIGAERRTTDTNNNGAIELAELYGAVKRQVMSATNGEQTPWIARNQMVGEAPLF